MLLCISASDTAKQAACASTSASSTYLSCACTGRGGRSELRASCRPAPPCGCAQASRPSSPPRRACSVRMAWRERWLFSSLYAFLKRLRRCSSGQGRWECGGGQRVVNAIAVKQGTGSWACGPPVPPIKECPLQPHPPPTEKSAASGSSPSVPLSNWRKGGQTEGGGAEGASSEAALHSARAVASPSEQAHPPSMDRRRHPPRMCRPPNRSRPGCWLPPGRRRPCPCHRQAHHRPPGPAPRACGEPAAPCQQATAGRAPLCRQLRARPSARARAPRRRRHPPRWCRRRHRPALAHPPCPAAWPASRLPAAS